MTTEQTTTAPGPSSSPPPRPPSGRPGGGGGRPPRGRRPRYYTRRKVCGFCVNKVQHVDYKDVSAIRRYLSDEAKIESRRKTGVCSKHQRALALAIKRARHLAMLPFARGHRGGY